ncbi:MAG TPA: Do family serine endopeptidase [Xanthobacteraceae bacterium]|jgi:serine protease Do|nr:Do family serine endopeptidase [Xanthobacteraceae bacterium]
MLLAGHRSSLKPVSRLAILFPQPGSVRRVAAGLAAGAVLALSLVVVPLRPASAAGRGPDEIADVAEKVIDSVVNISTSQTIAGGVESPVPHLPPGSPFEEFFDEFFKNHRGQGGGGDGSQSPRRVNSLGSGFIIDASGLVVTNNHVIADADEISVILNDGTKLKAEIKGRDTKTDLALLQVKTDKPLPAVHFGDSDALRLGQWVIAIGNPFSLGGTVTAGIVSARNRDINSGPYDNYIQTDAAINRGNSGGPLFNLNGEVIGVNTAIISPSGGSIGIGFAVPSRTVSAVIDQLREYGEARRGWLGVRIQQVTDDIADSLAIKPTRGVLIAGLDDRGPAKSAGLEVGDVIVKFDGKTVKDVRDLTRMVADSPVGKDVSVIVIRKGQEENKSVKLARLEDTDKKAEAKPAEKPPVVKKPETRSSLGLDIASINDDLRKQYKIKPDLSGVVIVKVDPNSAAAEKQLSSGEVIVQVSQGAVASTEDFEKRIAQLKKEGRHSALLLVANSDGDRRFVTIPLE